MRSLENDLERTLLVSYLRFPPASDADASTHAKHHACQSSQTAEDLRHAEDLHLLLNSTPERQAFP